MMSLDLVFNFIMLSSCIYVLERSTSAMAVDPSIVPQG